MKRKLWLRAGLLFIITLMPLALAGAQAGLPVDPYEGHEDLDNPFGPLELNTQYAAYLGTLYDRDVYYFDVNQAGTLKVFLSNVADNVTYGLILYDRDKTIASLDVQGKGDKVLDFRMSFSGRYYLMVDVRGETYDPKRPYLLHVATFQEGSERKPSPAGDSFEDNNTYATAYGPLQSGTTYEAYCWSQGDRDCYYVTVSSGTTIKAELAGICAECDYDLYLVDSAEQILADSENGQGVGESLTANVGPGTYYLVIHPYAGYSQEVPYQLTVTYADTAGGTQGPQPGHEAAWAKARIEEMGYTILSEPGVWEYADGTKTVVALEDPASLDLRIDDDVTWRQAIDTWGVLITAFDVHNLWIGLTYQNRYVIYYAVSSGDFGRFIHGELTRADLPVLLGIWDGQQGEWMSNSRDFVNKNFQ
jgi:hypothetical protein